MIYLNLITEFFKIGLFSFGGGFATIPFLVYISNNYNWYSLNELTQVIAVASITPGPVGINVATYAGFKTAGILGSLVSTISEMLPSLFIVIILSKILKKFKNNFYVKSAIETLKPISCAMLVSVVYGLFIEEIKNIESLIILLFLLILSIKTKKEPIFYMMIAGVLGIITKIYLL